MYQEQWEKVLVSPVKKQAKFLNKICKINWRDKLVLKGIYFDGLSFAIVKQIFEMIKIVVEHESIDFNLRELMFDRLLQVSKIAHLYPVDNDTDENIIHGEPYHVYSACYYDLDLISDFLNKHKDIQSLCDLGSGSGRALLYLALQVNHNMEFVGLELVKERVEFTNSIAEYFNLKNMLFKTSDFLENQSDLEGFNAYYLYDPVGTDDVLRLIEIFESMISRGDKFYMIFISGWDDLMLNALDKVDHLVKLESIKSRKQIDRYVNFYKVE